MPVVVAAAMPIIPTRLTMLPLPTAAFREGEAAEVADRATTALLVVSPDTMALMALAAAVAAAADSATSRLVPAARAATGS